MVFYLVFLLLIGLLIQLWLCVFSRTTEAISCLDRSFFFCNGRGRIAQELCNLVPQSDQFLMYQRRGVPKNENLASFSFIAIDNGDVIQ